MTAGSDGPAEPANAARDDTGAARDDTGGREPVSTRYREVLRTPLWWYPLAILVACVLAAEFRVGGLIETVWIPFGTIVPLSVVFVWWLGRAKLEIRDGEVRIHGAHLALRYVSGAVGLDPRTLRLVVGREGDPAAFVQIRPWIGPGVQLWLDDEDDPAPYWVVSTRHPERVLQVIGSYR